MGKTVLMRKDLTYLWLEKALDACLLRHKVIANNIANVSTPGFKRLEVVFEEELKALLNKKPISLSQLKKVEPEIIEDQNSTWREDFNNVDIEKEMVELSKNTLQYNLYIQLLNGKLERIRKAIAGR